MEMKAEWINAENIPKGKIQSFAELFTSKKSEEIILNKATEVEFLKIANDIYYPVTINDLEGENSFVCSPYTAYALYSKEELKSKVKSKIVQLPLLLFIKLIGQWLKFSNIDKNVQVNNFLLSTNPYPEWEGNEINEITSSIKAKYPNHAIIFRSLNIYQHQNLIERFVKNGYEKIGSRQVYIYDMEYADWAKHNNNKHDQRIINKQQLIKLNHDEMAMHLEEALNLYNQLYLEKYSKYNPQFTLEYFKKCHESKLMYFQGYKDQNDRLLTFSGLFLIGNTITSPLVGYDTSAPQKQGLYIHAINLIMEYKFKHQKLLNLSSGAPKFKKLRGGLPSIEYSVVYTAHLSLKRKMAWKILKFISNHIGVPLVKKYEL
jgi:hypothetical protein